MESRSIRRLPESQQWDATAVLSMKGLPWNYMGRSRRKRALYTQRVPLLPDSATLDQLARAAGQAAAEAIAAATPDGRPPGTTRQPVTHRHRQAQALHLHLPQGSQRKQIEGSSQSNRTHRGIRAVAVVWARTNGSRQQDRARTATRAAEHTTGIRRAVAVVWAPWHGRCSQRPSSR